MQRIIQVNIAGRTIPIEEDAYFMLRDYISALERQFTGADGKEIIEDIENRIAELFSIRLQGGSPAIDRADVQKVISTLGAPGELHEGSGASSSTSGSYSSRQGGSQSYTGYTTGGYRRRPQQQRLLRDPYNKMIGGVCSGVAHYFDIDPVIVRLIMVGAFLTFGVGFLAYIIAWAIIPAAGSEEELYTGRPVTFHDISRNMADELQDLKRRGEQMSRELRDFFSRKDNDNFKKPF